MSALEDATTQQKGLCLIKYDVRERHDGLDSFGGNPFQQFQHRRHVPTNSRYNDSRSNTVVNRQGAVDDKDYYGKMSKFHESFPIKIMALHLCYVNTSFISNLFRVVVENYARFDRAKIRFHRGKVVFGLLRFYWSIFL